MNQINCSCKKPIIKIYKCSKCTDKIEFCSNNCLVQHNFSNHQNMNDSYDIKPKLSVSKRPNKQKEMSLNNDTNNTRDNISNNISNTNINTNQQADKTNNFDNDISQELKNRNNLEKFHYRNFHVVKIGSNRQVLGKGAFAEVCLVKHKLDENFYAMKIIDKKKLKNNTEIVKLEINNHLHFNHPNIIKLYSYSETKDFFYLAMEYAENGNIFNEIKRIGKLNEITAKKFFIEVIDAVSYLHKLGFAHRDIKPENILLDSEKRVKLCDFGGTVMIGEVERKTFFGTYEYMAPEIIEGNKYDSSVDIWALGVLLYEFLHGHSPFRVSR